MPLWEGNDVVGAVNRIHAVYEDTLAGIGEKKSLGYLELVHANPAIDPWLPGDGAPIILPSRYILPDGPREGIVINLAEYRLYYYQDNKVSTYPVGIGKSSSPSPLARTEVTVRLESPTWYPPESVLQEYVAEGETLPRVIPPGPENPLGPYALQLAEDGYLIHGTNKRFGVGMQVSHGCFRMYNEDISELIWNVPIGTAVRVIDEPVKFGVEDDDLWVEVHRFDSESASNSEESLLQAAMEQLEVLKKQKPKIQLNRQQLEQALAEANGIPQRVGKVMSQVASDRAEGNEGPASG